MPRQHQLVWASGICCCRPNCLELTERMICMIQCLALTQFQMSAENSVVFRLQEHKVPTPNIQDPLAEPHQELRGCSACRSWPGIGSHRTPSKFCLRSHCQRYRRYASTPSTPVSCWSDSRPSSRAQLEASSRSSEQPMDRPAPQERQWHTTSWPVEKIHHALLYGSDATVLDDYALTMTTSSYSALEVSPFMCYMLYITAYLLAIFLVHTVSGLDLQQWPRRHIQWTVGINHSIWLPCRRQILFSGSRRRRNAAVFCLKLSIIIVVVIVVARSRRNL